MTGITRLPSAAHLVVAPYVTAAEEGHPRDSGDIRSAFVNKPIKRDAGIDAKWTPNPDIAVDATVNPDFSQVESDVAQIGVNERFALFFPEKRPFFLEGVDLFQTPIRAVHTQTITSPRWGARATGKIASSAYTLLLSEDRGRGSFILPGPTFSDLAPQDFGSFVAIGRLRHDFGRSFAGLLLTDREIEGGSHNRLIGPDFQWRPNDKNQITGQFLYSDTQTPDRPELVSEWDGRRLSSGALSLFWIHSTRGMEWLLTYRDFGDGFRADDGFVPQVGYRREQGRLSYNFYPEGFSRRVRPLVFADYTAGRNGVLLFRRFAPGVTFQGRWNMQGEIDYNFDAVRSSGRVFERKQVFYSLQVDPSRRIPRVGVTGFLGEEIDFANSRVGDGGRIGANATARPTEHLDLQFNGDYQWLNVMTEEGREGRLFTAWVGRLKATYTFTARMFLRLIGQYVSTRRDPSLYRRPVSRRSGSFDASALFSYKLNWQTVLFLGYGESRVLLPDNDLVPSGRRFFLKISYAIQR